MYIPVDLIPTRANAQVAPVQAALTKPPATLGAIEAAPLPTAKAVRLTPRPYQVEGINFLRTKKRGILADRAGLGKTLQASRAMKPPAIVACPSYLVFQWFDFLIQEYPELKVTVCYGTRSEREKALSTPSDVWIMNIEMLRDPHISENSRIGGYVKPRGIRTLIVDEAHHLRGRDSLQTKGAQSIANNAEYVFLLTATPLYKDVADAYSLLRLLDRKAFSSYWTFLREYVVADYNGFSTRVVKAKQAFRKIWPDYCLERTYADVGAQLPRQIGRTIMVRPDEKFMQKYRAVKEQFIYNEKDVNSMMEAMHIMRRMTADLKLEHALELLVDEPEGIIGTYYRSTAEILAHLIKIPFIHGDIPAAERQKIVKQAKLLTATIASVGEGADFSHLNHVILFEGDYVPARLYQFISRVRRLREGDAPVRVTYIVVKGTIDEIVHNAAQTRNADIMSVMKEALL